jgi:hypothetical protein
LRNTISPPPLLFSYFSKKSSFFCRRNCLRVENNNNKNNNNRKKKKTPTTTEQEVSEWKFFHEIAIVWYNNWCYGKSFYVSFPALLDVVIFRLVSSAFIRWLLLLTTFHHLLLNRKVKAMRVLFSHWMVRREKKW